MLSKSNDGHQKRYTAPLDDNDDNNLIQSNSKLLYLTNKSTASGIPPFFLLQGNGANEDTYPSRKSDYSQNAKKHF